MTLEQLRIFLAVAEREHVTRAAEALNLTQAAVSASISALETQHDVRLFDRIGRRIALTEAGHALVGEARAVLARAETARLVLADHAAHATGRLRLGASQTVASYWLPPVLVGFRKAHPRVMLELTFGNTDRIAHAVAEGTADLGVVEGETVLPGLRGDVLAEDALVLVLPRGTAPPDASALPGFLRAQSWVLREPGSGTRALAEQVLADAGLGPQDPGIVLDLPSNEAVLAAVAAGGGAAMLSERATAAAAAAGTVTCLPLPGARRQFRVLSHRDRYRTRAVTAMLEMLSAAGSP